MQHSFEKNFLLPLPQIYSETWQQCLLPGCDWLNVQTGEISDLKALLLKVVISGRGWSAKYQAAQQRKWGEGVTRGQQPL